MDRQGAPQDLSAEDLARGCAGYDRASELPPGELAVFVTSSLPEGQLRESAFELLDELSDLDDPTPSSPPTLQPGDTLGRFQIQEQIGVGGMGRVFRAV